METLIQYFFFYLFGSVHLSCKNFLQDSAADRHKHRKMEAVYTVRGLLMMGA
jgi:hypothetical protein